MKPFLILSFFICSLLSAPAAFSQSPLLDAIRNNDLSQVITLLNRNADVQARDSDGDNALMYAALYSTIDCMKLLLQKGAHPDVPNDLGETAIMWCSHDLEKTKLLLEYKANLHLRTTDGNTALLGACVGNSQYEIIKLLLDHGADALAVNNKNITTLMRVAQYGDTGSARLLINKGVGINAEANDHQTALFYAIKSSNKEMLYWLIANGADANIKDNYKATALSYAVILSDLEIAKALLPITRGINEQDIDGTTILMWAIYSEYDNPAIIQLLLDNGALPNLADKKGKTALTWALEKGNTATVVLLKKAGAIEGVKIDKAK